MIKIKSGIKVVYFIVYKKNLDTSCYVVCRSMNFLKGCQLCVLWFFAWIYVSLWWFFIAIMCDQNISEDFNDLVEYVSNESEKEKQSEEKKERPSTVVQRNLEGTVIFLSVKIIITRKSGLRESVPSAFYLLNQINYHLESYQTSMKY